MCIDISKLFLLLPTLNFKFEDMSDMFVPSFILEICDCQLNMIRKAFLWRVWQGKMKWNEIDFLVQKSGRLMELKMHQGCVKLANSLEYWNAVAFEDNINLLSNWKKRFPNITFSSSDWNLFLMKLYRKHFNTNCASFSTTLLLKPPQPL